VAIANESDSDYKVPHREPVTLASTEVRAAQRVVIPARCEAHVALQTAAIELCLIQNRICAGPDQGLVRPTALPRLGRRYLKVPVINTSHQERISPKGMVLGVTLPIRHKWYPFPATAFRPLTQSSSRAPVP
jgi:hypothetical protein